jgi:hypothetical protein
LLSVDSSGRRKGLYAMLANVLLSGLAAGALWCLLSLGTDRDTTVLIMPLALIIAWFLRWQGYRERTGVYCVVGATLLAFVYAQYLFAEVNMAQLLGFPLRDTLFKMDFGLAWQLVRAHMGIGDIALLIAACAMAAAVAQRPGRSPAT